MKIFKKNKINFKSGHALSLSNGFTFIELIVVISIFAIMGSIVMFNFRDFTANIDLKNLASDIALNIKNAQTLALSGDVKYVYNPTYGYNQTYGTDDPLSDPDFSRRESPTYGIFFARYDDVQGLNPAIKKFVLFRDKNFNMVYNSNAGCSSTADNTECLGEKPIEIESNDKILKFCVSDNNNIKTCSDTANQNIKGLAITFKRPYPDAIITLEGQSGVALPGNYQKAEIFISNINDEKKQRIITVTNLGQISVK